MVSEILLFIFALLVTVSLLFVIIYFLITLSDLECDYLNAQECCAKLNFVRDVRKKSDQYNVKAIDFCCSGTSQNSGFSSPSSCYFF